ncbi:MAG: fibronectin type III domain-containing protein [Lachnospiraceae bacterium]|nr:fibronectin type III domain-containing protein [Lachnospiraceae bacterium]
MKQINKRVIQVCLGMGFALLSGLGIATVSMAKTTVLQTDVSTPSSGCTFVGIEGSYKTDAAAALKRINEIRLEACREGVPNPSDPLKALQESDYVPLKWSADLEYIARIRAAEAIVVTGHTRPNGKSCFSLKSPKGVSSSGEVLAWNSSSSMITGVNQWYQEKEDWVQGNNAVTGHYTSMIDPSNTSVGLGLFTSSNGAWPGATCGRFSRASQQDTAQSAAVPSCVQMIETQQVYLSSEGSIEEVGTSQWNQLGVGDRLECALMQTLTSGVKESRVRAMGQITWTSSNTKVAAVSAAGVLTITGKGTAVIKATAQSGTVGSRSITVKSNLASVKLQKLQAGRKKLVVRWKTAKNVKGYQIQYGMKKNFKSGAKKVTVKGAGKKSKTLKGLKSKRKYYIRIRSYTTKNGKKVYSAWSAVKSAKTK